MEDKRLIEYRLYEAANICVTKDDAIMRDAAAELSTLRAENERLREKLYDITGRSAMAFKQLHDSLLNQAKDELK